MRALIALMWWQRVMASESSNRHRWAKGGLTPVNALGVGSGRDRRETKVIKVEHMDDSQYGVVTMEIEDNGLPIHKDATVKIRPRLSSRATSSST